MSQPNARRTLPAETVRGSLRPPITLDPDERAIIVRATTTTEAVTGANYIFTKERNFAWDEVTATSEARDIHTQLPVPPRLVITGRNTQDGTAWTLFINGILCGRGQASAIDGATILKQFGFGDDKEHLIQALQSTAPEQLSIKK